MSLEIQEAINRQWKQICNSSSLDSLGMDEVCRDRDCGNCPLDKWKCGEGHYESLEEYKAAFKKQVESQGYTIPKEQVMSTNGVKYKAVWGDGIGAILVTENNESWQTFRKETGALCSLCHDGFVYHTKSDFDCRVASLEEFNARQTIVQTIEYHKIEYVYDRCYETGAIVVVITKQTERNFEFFASNGKRLRSLFHPHYTFDDTTIFLLGEDETADKAPLTFRSREEFEQCFALPVSEYNESRRPQC